MRNATILSTGMHVPEQVLTNQFFDEKLGVNVSTWLEETAQIYERRWCGPEEATSDLCLGAANEALSRAGISASDLDLLIVATDTPDFVSPATSAVVQHKLGASKAGVFDLNTACAGFVTAMDMASHYLRSHTRATYVIVIGAYAMSKHLNKEDKKTVTLFADGAGAVLLKAEETEDRGYLASQLHALGQYHDGMGIYAGGTRQPVDDAALTGHDHQLKFVYKFPADLNRDEWSRMAHQMAADIGLTVNEVDRFFITQVNVNSIYATMDHLELPRERAHTVMHKYAYTGSACIPMALHDAVEKEQIKRGDLLFFIGSGGGLSFASAAFRY